MNSRSPFVDIYCSFLCMNVKESVSLLCSDVREKLLLLLGINAINHYYYRHVATITEANAMIHDALMSDKSTMICRCGTVECQAVYKFLHARNKLPIGSPIMDVLCNNAGFFPKDETSWYRFGELMLDSFQFADIQAVLFSGGGENYLLKHYAPQAKLIALGALDPVYGWTEALEGRRVLVIHPFEETIRNQYKNHRKEIFKGTNYLPDFELFTIKAVQTIAGTKDNRFNSWFSALDYMTDEVAKVDFDVAIIGCGAYGYPLAARIKQMGKKAVHMGGSSQLLFGIYGDRWINHPRIKPWINNSWVRPSVSEKPAGFNNVEGGCYW